ncbi:MAG: hypothetical protein JRN68_04950 [Nitrososphaerota archaeon]|nr:hypothetical protein [Nitrososphaerota archaeon]
MKSEVVSCPICGSTNVLSQDRPDNLTSGRYERGVHFVYYMCMMCGASWHVEDNKRGIDSVSLLRFGRIASLVACGLLILNLYSVLRFLVGNIFVTAGFFDLLMLIVNSHPGHRNIQETMHYT